MKRSSSNSGFNGKKKQKACYEQKNNDEKIRILDEISAGASQRDVAKKYGLGRATIQRWLEKADIIRGSLTSDRKHTVVKPKYNEVETIVCNFLREARECGTCITGPVVCQLAAEEAKRLGINDFKASDGWLSRVKARHGIKGKILSGEAASVNISVLNDWENELPNIIKGYDEKDVYNCDETGLFYKASTKQSLVLPGDSGHHGKVSKDRVTVLLTTSWAGEKLKPTVIGKSLNPRSLKGADRSRLIVRYEAQKKAWMVGGLLKSISSGLTMKLGGKILVAKCYSLWTMRQYMFWL